MIDLGTTELFIAGPTLPRDEFETYSTQLFEDWDGRLQNDLALPDYSISLEVEDGSLTVVGTVGATLLALYVGIGNYGSFVAGLETISKQVRAAGDHLSARASAPFTRLNLRPRIRRKGGTLGQLQRLFIRVQRREISVEEAVGESERILGDEDLGKAEFLDRLSSALSDVRIPPQQLVLPMDLPEDRFPKSDEQIDAGSAPVRPKPVLSPKPRFRVEFWRESKTGKREMRIVEL